MERRKFVIGAGALATGSAAAMGTGAFSAARLDGRDANISVSSDSDALIGLEAGSTELVEETNDMLEIDFDADNESGQGVNPGSTYQVGAVGENGASALDTNVSGIDRNDLLWGDASPAEDGGSSEDEHAFKLVNQSDTGYDIELFWEGDGSGTPSDVTVVLIGETDDNQEGAGAFVVDPEGDAQEGRIGGFPLKSGDAHYVSILVIAGDNADVSEDFNGELVVQAGEAEGNYDY